MAIAISGAPVRLREVILKDKPEEMIAASPKGTVPVLTGGREVIDESLAIMRWALAQNDPEGWLSRNDEALIESCDGPFKHALDRYKYAARYEDADPLFYRDEGMKFLETLEARLSEKAFLCGDDRGFTDIAIFPFARQFRTADENWFDAAPINRVQDWLQRLTGSKLILSVMKKYPAWKESGEEFSFPEATTA